MADVKGAPGYESSRAHGVPQHSNSSPAEGSGGGGAAGGGGGGGRGLSVEGVCELLDANGMGVYSGAFREGAIDGTMLGELDELWADPLGVENKAHRIRIQKALGLR